MKDQKIYSIWVDITLLVTYTRGCIPTSFIMEIFKRFGWHITEGATHNVNAARLFSIHDSKTTTSTENQQNTHKKGNEIKGKLCYARIVLVNNENHDFHMLNAFRANV